MPRILIVDDERIVADTLAMIFNRNGFEAVVSYSGVDAVARAVQFAPELALIDVGMEELDGIDTAISICRALPHCRIYLISGNMEAGERLAAAREMGHHFEIVPKPIPPAVLVEKMRAGLAAPPRDSTSAVESEGRTTAAPAPKPAD